MPWREQTAMSEREEFVQLARQEAVPFRELCRRFTISPKTGYKWLRRAEEAEPDWSADQSRRPHTSPGRTSPEIEEQVVAARLAHPNWGGRKLSRCLGTQEGPPVPAPSTITDILRRHGLIDPEVSLTQRPFHRFEHPHPNALWQVDFMGHLPTATQRLHPLTLIDDHSRYALGLWACPNQQGTVVHTHLTEAFRRYGLPVTILSDNGPPWGASGGGGMTTIEAWLIRLGITVRHGRPDHPQTQGKIERFHKTLGIEVTRNQVFSGLDAAQKAFDAWRPLSNTIRPHEGIAYAVPADRYRPSPVPFPETLPPIEYESTSAVCQVRKVRSRGTINFQRREFFLSKGLGGLPVAVRATPFDGVFSVYFCHQQIAVLDLTKPEEV